MNKQQMILMIEGLLELSLVGIIFVLSAILGYNTDFFKAMFIANNIYFLISLVTLTSFVFVLGASNIWEWRKSRKK